MCSSDLENQNGTGDAVKSVFKNYDLSESVGGMVAVLGLDYEKVEKLTIEASTHDYKCWIANDNTVGQVVLSGHIQAIDKVVEIAKQFGAKRAMKLTVSAPFHCELIKPAMDIMEQELDKIEFNSLSVPIITNVTAKPQTDVNVVKNGLVEQVCGRVRWRETIDEMLNLSVSELVECGSGKVLSGMVRRVESINSVSLNKISDIEDFVKTL